LFHTVNYRDKDIIKAHLQNINKIIKNFYINLKTVIIIFNASIKNNVAISTLYIYSGQNILAKKIHYTVNITSTEAELFAIRYEINQVIHL